MVVALPRGRRIEDMEKAPIVATRPLFQVMPNVDAMFYLALSLVIVAIGMGISLRP
jgi:hypothetical protein